MESLKSEFLLDAEVTFLNHGSWGATPAVVFEAYLARQRHLESEPVRFYQLEFMEELAQARETLASYLNCAAQDLVYFPNPTSAGNVIARSLKLQPGDEILTTDHTYGAFDRTWQFVAKRTGAVYIQRPVQLPVTTHADFVDYFWEGVNDRTRVIFLDHLTSPTALRFPVEAICARARSAGILTVIDGAHAPGHVPIDLEKMDPDAYFGACHKWMCAPKGSAFLYARRDLQPRLDPLVVSWGYGEPGYDTGIPFINQHEKQGTQEVSAYLSVADSIQFMEDHDWSSVQKRCRELAVHTRNRICELTGLGPICPDSPDWFNQFFTAELPITDALGFKDALYGDFKVQAPIIEWGGKVYIRVSFQAYNSTADADQLMLALEQLLPKFQS